MIPERITSRLTNYGDPDLCWEWQGSLTRGYGTTGYLGRDWYVHRLTYTLLVGEIPEGLEIDHLCRNPPCSNIAHLEPVTGAENRRRAAAARPVLTHCLRGHERTPENLTTTRTCRVCVSDRDAVDREPMAHRKTECIHGHKLTPDNVYITRGTGARGCRTCKNEQKRARRAAARPTREGASE